MPQLRSSQVIALFAAAAALTGCAPEKQLYVSDAWVRLAAVPGRPAAGYFTVHGGTTDATLVSVSTDVAIRAEMHETKQSRGVMSMDAVRNVAIPASGKVTFAPGGRHLMLFDVNASVKPGSTMTLTFTFADGLGILKEARVIAAADGAPKS